MLSWSFGQLVNWAVGHLVSWLIGQLVSWPVDQLVNWSVGQFVSWSIGQLSVDQLVSDAGFGRLEERERRFRVDERMKLRPQWAPLEGE